MRTKLAIFDLDGTLLNTLDDLANACNHALAALGFPGHALEEYNRMVGRGIRNLFRAALPQDRITDENLDRMTAEFIPFYNAHIADRTRPYSGIPALLNRISAAGVEVATASNKYQEGTEQLMTTFFPEIRFVRILGQRRGIRSRSRNHIPVHGVGSRHPERRSRLYRRFRRGHADRGKCRSARDRSPVGISATERTGSPPPLEIGRKR